MMSTKSARVKAKKKPSEKHSWTKQQEQGLDRFSSFAAIAGLSASVIAAIELSIPVMILAALAGAASALSKLAVSKHGE